MKIAVIPARGGSKRIPRKNIKEFCGIPMISWAINTAKKSNLFDHIIVSTDDEEIAKIGSKYGAEIPFLRPIQLADDFTSTAAVIAHAVKMCMDNGWPIKYVCCIYPCVPFLQVDDLIAAFDLMKNKAVNFVYPVTQYPHPIERAMRILPGGRMEFFKSECELLRTQDLEIFYHDAGQFYWGKASAWLQQKKMHTDGLGMEIPRWRVVDIDSINDWVLAEHIYKANFLLSSQVKLTR